MSNTYIALKEPPKALANDYTTSIIFEQMPKIYLVGCWARYGVREHYFTGYYREIDGKSIPLVYDYFDANGTDDEWRLVPITHTTTGEIITWTQNKFRAHQIAEALNYNREHRRVCEKEE